MQMCSSSTCANYDRGQKQVIFLKGSYLITHLGLAHDESPALSVNPPRPHALEEHAALSTHHHPHVTSSALLHTFVAFPLCFIRMQPQKIRGAHSIPVGEKKRATEGATQRQNKQISKHFYTETSNVPCDETARRSLF